MKKTITILFCVLFSFCLFSCEKETDSQTPVLTYTENTTLGKGENQISLEVCYKNESIFFTIYTNEKDLGSALLESGLIKAEQGDFGLYIKEVNSIRADAKTDNAYWSVLVNNEPSAVGISSIIIDKNNTYKLVYTNL